MTLMHDDCEGHAPGAVGARGRLRTSSCDGTAEDIALKLRRCEAEAADLRRRLSLITSNASTPSGNGGDKPLAIIVPMVGLGETFAEAGFLLPKPLVKVVGRPVLLWLLDQLSFNARDVVYLAVPAVMERQHGIEKLVAREFPALNLTVVSVPFQTRGWVETVFSVVRQMPARVLRMRLVTLDCSTIYHGIDVLGKVRELPEGAGASFCFDIESTAARKGAVAAQFSYVQLDAEGFITCIREKQVISSLANTGAYIFPTARDLRQAAEQFLDVVEATAGGLYASSLISAMIQESFKFMGVLVSHELFEIVSTPAQLRAFTHRVSAGSLNMVREMRFCFDLEGTLVTEPRCPGELTTCDPIPKAIALVRQLHAAGHTIIITTSRGMGQGRGVDAAMASAGATTLAQLAQFNIPYDELHFGKPSADVYVDTQTLNAQADIERDLGWCVDPELSATDPLDGAIDSRSFNSVRAKGQDSVIKSSSPQLLRGECHWYRSIPKSVAHLFPRPLEIIEGHAASDLAAVGGCMVSSASSRLSSITMVKVKGITFSHLVTARLLLKASLRRLMQALHAVHVAKPPAEAVQERLPVSALCQNYAPKVKSRIAAHRDLYRSLGQEFGIDVERMAEVVVAFLEEFEASGRPQHAHYIHGDPVFSNVISTPCDDIVFIDMRGELGSQLTTQGDVHYDLSKVYQSLCGYDFMLLDQLLDETSSEIFDDLRAAFWEELRSLYPDVSHRDVRLHAAAHFFSIVPLHEVRSRMARYLRTSYSMLSVEGMM